jgi:transketolase N-terminal domain/subunit
MGLNPNVLVELSQGSYWPDRGWGANMLRVLSDDEVKEGQDRRAFLYASAFTIDNLTAVLMDTKEGGMGLDEPVARAKAHAIVGWLKTVTGVDISTQRPQ